MHASVQNSPPPSFLPTANPVPHDPAPPVDFRARLGRPLRVRWEGDLSPSSPLARVNRELCLGLLQSSDVELTFAERATAASPLTEKMDCRFAPLSARRGARPSGPVDVTVRHAAFPSWRRPESGKLIIMQSWAHGHVPREWQEGAIQHADEVWVPSRFSRDAFVRGGVWAEKVRLIPPGFDPAVFTPVGTQYPLPTQRSVRFLFVGNLSEREGADLLLGAYLRAFTPADDVCLVVKRPAGSNPAGNPESETEGERAFRRAQADPGLPEIVLLDDDLSGDQMAAPYRACSCLVLPYRGLSYGLSVLEGMACGKPSIVTAGGPTDDILDETMGWRLPHRLRSAGGWTAGSYECAGDPWLLEPDREALVAVLRQVYDHPDEARVRGAAACKAVQAGWRWEHSLAQLRARLLEVAVPASPSPFVPATLWWEPKDGGVRSQGLGVRRGKGRGRNAADFVGLTPDPRPLTPTLSLCMMVRDEEPRLPKCLQSIAPYVDEIVVVDTGSKDRTREIARDCGARVFEFPWTDSFAEARNQTVEQARGDWILRMDADDVISPEDAAQLRPLIQRYPNRDVAFLMEYWTPTGPGGCVQHVVDQIKLFPRRPDLRFEFRDHEQLLPAILRAGMAVVHSHLSVTHRNYDWSPEGQAQRRRRHFRLLHLDLREQGEHPFVLYNLGTTYLYETREYEVAAHYLLRCLRAADPSDNMVRMAHGALVTTFMGAGDWHAALAANEEGRRHYPEDAELLLQAGQILQQLGRLDEARWALERLVLGYDEPEYRCAESGLRTYRGRHELALLLWRQGQLPHCEQILREVVATYPTYLPAQLHQVEALHALGQTEAARQLLAGIPAAAGIEAELDHLRRLVESA